MENLENNPVKIDKRGGPRPNSGRPKGGKNKETLEREAAERVYKQRVIKAIQPLVNSQLTLARGVNYLYKIEKTKNSNGKTEKSKPILVTQQTEIEGYLSGEFDDQEDVYYYLTTDKPENRAIDSMLDRVFGKAVESVKLSNPDGTPLSGPNIYLPAINKKDYERVEASPRSTGEFPPIGGV